MFSCLRRPSVAASLLPWQSGFVLCSSFRHKSGHAVYFGRCRLLLDIRLRLPSGGTESKLSHPVLVSCWSHNPSETDK